MEKKTSLGIFRFLAGFVSVYHLILGLIGTFASSETVLWVIHEVYGVSPTVDPQFLILTKFISAYMLAFAVGMALLAWKPVQYRNLVWVPLTLFIIRIVERLVFFTALSSTFHITMGQNMRVIIPIAIITIGLFFLRPKNS